MTLLLCACMIGPMPLVELLSTRLLQPGGRPAFLTRWRLFRLSGAGRCRSALWLVR
jgi:hypothetical protein